MICVSSLGLFLYDVVVMLFEFIMIVETCIMRLMLLCETSFGLLLCHAVDVIV